MKSWIAKPLPLFLGWTPVNRLVGCAQNRPSWLLFVMQILMMVAPHGADAKFRGGCDPLLESPALAEFTLSVDGVEFNPSSFIIRYKGRELKLSPLHYQVLEWTMAGDELLTPDGFSQIYERLNNGHSPADANSLMATVKRRVVENLKKEDKLGLDLSDKLKFLYGRGLVYINDPPPGAARASGGRFRLHPLKTYLTFEGRYVHLIPKQLDILHLLAEPDCAPKERSTILTHLEHDSYKFKRGLTTLQEDVSDLNSSIANAVGGIGPLVEFFDPVRLQINKALFDGCGSRQ